MLDVNQCPSELCCHCQSGAVCFNGISVLGVLQWLGAGEVGGYSGY